MSELPKVEIVHRCNCHKELMENEMNEEYQIAQAIIDAQKMQEESYDNLQRKYILEIEQCLILSCQKHKLSPNLWALLAMAVHWWNDIQLWAEDILAGRDVETEPLPETEDVNCIVDEE